MRDGMQHLDILPVKKMSMKVMVNGKEYASIRQAGRMTGEGYTRTYKKLKRGEEGYIKLDS